jgi:hypothetical protein
MRVSALTEISQNTLALLDILITQRNNNGGRKAILIETAAFSSLN